MTATFTLRRAANDPVRWLISISAGVQGGGPCGFCTTVAASSEGEALQIVGDAIAAQDSLSKNSAEGRTVRNVYREAETGTGD
jgi:hypothetical protein